LQKTNYLMRSCFNVFKCLYGINKGKVVNIAQKIA
jgi:hypothetical protein